jgi:hypothetical protein
MLTLTLTTAREVHLLRSLLQSRIDQLDKEADGESAGAATLHRRQAQELREMLSRVQLDVPAASAGIN